MAYLGVKRDMAQIILKPPPPKKKIDNIVVQSTWSVLERKHEQIARNGLVTFMNTPSLRDLRSMDLAYVNVCSAPPLCRAPASLCVIQ